MAIQVLKAEEISNVSGGAGANPIGSFVNLAAGGFVKPLQALLLDPFSKIAGQFLTIPLLRQLNIPVIG